MGKLPAGFDLGNELRSHRKAARLTQADLAQTARLAERTVRALEQGRGTLDSWSAALVALGLTLAGRNLPGGKTLGERLTTLRRRRGLSQHDLARLVGVTRPTVGALEREGRGRLATLQRRAHGGFNPTKVRDVSQRSHQVLVTPELSAIRSLPDSRSAEGQ